MFSSRIPAIQLFCWLHFSKGDKVTATLTFAGFPSSWNNIWQGASESAVFWEQAANSVLEKTKN